MDFSDIWGRPCSPSTILRYTYFLLTDTEFFFIYVLLRQVEHYEFIFNLQFSLLLKKKKMSITSNFKSVSFFSSFFTLYIYSQISTCRQVGPNTNWFEVTLLIPEKSLQYTPPSPLPLSLCTHSNSNENR